MRRFLTINPGTHQDGLAKEQQEESDLMKKDEHELSTLKETDGQKEEFDHVDNKDKDEEGVEGEEKVVKAKYVRLPRVRKPTGDVLEELMKMDIGSDKVKTFKNVNENEIEKQLLSCLNK